MTGTTGERLNDKFLERVEQNPLAGTPLFEAAQEQPTLTPPRTDKDSVARQHAFEHLPIGDRQRRVLQVIANYQPISSLGIARELEWPLHWVSGRLTELRKHYGLIVDAGTQYVGKKKYTVYKLNPEKFS
jgi:hypothetical protein